MFKFLKDLDNYEVRKVDRTQITDVLEVSTAWTSDEGFETAIIDNDGTHPVERYPGYVEAEEGHEKWIKLAKEFKNGTKITKLGGLRGLVPDGEITLDF